MQVSLRDFQLRASSYLKELPIVLTVYNVPKYTVSAYVSADKGLNEEVLTDNGFIEDVSAHTAGNVSTPKNSKKIPEVRSVCLNGVDAELRKVHKAMKQDEFHECSWDKAIKCKSPGTEKVRGKWYCKPHSLLV